MKRAVIISACFCGLHCSPTDTVAFLGVAGSAGAAGSRSSGGASGAGGASGKGGGAGAGGAPYDARSDIGFDWPEGPTKNPCKAGVYQGNFSCTYMPGDAGVGTFPVSGPITLKMVPSQQGEFLEVREGLLDGTANLFFTLRADISGRLDCRAAKFAGTLENGVYSGFLVINGTFQGPLSSDYDRAASQFSNGVWSLAVNMGNGGCNGTWSAAYVGPAD
ncbi:MAG: hypothetical protein ABW133_07415 [Polyangiaceae bacterium]